MNANNPPRASVAIDLSYLPARLAIAVQGEAKTSEIIEYNSTEIRNGANLLKWISESLKMSDLHLEDIENWTIGSGPGAFSQIRMLSAITLGLSLKMKKMKIRGLASGSAFSSLFPHENTQFSVLYQLMKNIIVLSSFQKNGENCKLLKISATENLTNIKNEIRDAKHIVALAQQKETIPLDMLTLNDKIIYPNVFPVKELIKLNPDSWDPSSVTDLIYARPPAIAPKTTF